MASSSLLLATATRDIRSDHLIRRSPNDLQGCVDTFVGLVIAVPNVRARSPQFLIVRRGGSQGGLAVVAVVNGPGTGILSSMSHDDLIQRIQRRAWDPARRESTVYVPLGWLKRAYGEKVTGRIQHYRSRQPSNEGGSVTSLYWGPEPQDSLMEAALESGAPEALKYFSSVPHEPPYPPISHKDLRACEERIGQELPDLLRRVYTEVSNGGFGPAYSLLGCHPAGTGHPRPARTRSKNTRNTRS